MRSKTTMAWIAAVVLAGCSNSNSPSSGSATEKMLEFTSTNAVAVTKTTSDTFQIFDTALFVSQLITADVGVYKNGVPLACASTIHGAGTVTLQSNAAGRALRAGDVLAAVFSNCQMDPSYDELLTGLASIKINSITGDPTESGAAAPWAFTAEATLTQLTETTYGQTRVLDGVMNIAISTSGPVAPHVETDNVSFTVPSMRIQHNGDTHEYRGYEGTLVQDIGIHGLTYAATVSGAIISTVLGGRIDVKTMTAFGGAAPVEEPTTGRALITGASGHTIDLQPAAKGVVNLLLTTPTSSTAQAIVTSWTELEQ